MRKFFSLILALMLVLGLTSCARTYETVWDAERDGTALQDSAAFSEELEEVDADTAFALYRLSACGLERQQLSGAWVRRSAGATCEECAILTFDSQDAASSAKSALEDYVQNQISSNQDYRPAEIPKLEKAWLDQRGATLLMVIANDLDAAKDAVE